MREYYFNRTPIMNNQLYAFNPLRCVHWKDCQWMNEWLESFETEQTRKIVMRIKRSDQNGCCCIDCTRLHGTTNILEWIMCGGSGWNNWIHSSNWTTWESDSWHTRVRAFPVKYSHSCLRSLSLSLQSALNLSRLLSSRPSSLVTSDHMILSGDLSRPDL